MLFSLSVVSSAVSTLRRSVFVPSFVFILSIFSHTPGLISNAGAGVPVISDLSDNTVLEQSAAQVYDEDITFSEGVNYADGYLRYAITGGTADDTFALSSDADANAVGAITTDGTFVYLGNGSDKTVIAIIDATEDGSAGQPLKILFYRAVDNGGFESGDTSDWSVYNVQYPGDADLNGDPIPWKRLTDVGNGLTGTGEISIGTDNGMTYAVTADNTVVSSGTWSLRLRSSGVITHLNEANPAYGANPESGYGSIHGPYVECTPFAAYNGDLIYVDWSAVHQSDWYEVLGYLVASGGDDTFGDGNETETLLFKQRGDEQDWTTVATPITSDDTYKFRFVSGTYDATGGYAVGAYLYIDNIRIVTGVTIDDDLLTDIAHHITFQNTTDLGADLVRDLTVSVETNSKDTDSVTRSLRITTTVDPTPFIATNSGLTLNEGATAAISSGILKASDMDTYDENLIFTITTAPANGILQHADNPGVTVTTFTQEDISNNKIQYVHDGSETLSDGFSFSVSDGTNQITDQSFAITVTPVNDTPVVAVNFGLRFPESGSGIITSYHLAATDAETSDAELTFTITTPTANGRIETTDNPGVVLTTFTQQMIIDNKLRYVHDGSETTSDSFIFKVSDGTAEQTGQTFSIAPGEDDEPLATIQNPPLQITNATSYSIYVGGIGVTAYRYKIDDEVAWRAETSVATPISLTLSTEGEHTLYLIGKDSSDTWQEGIDATTVTWTIDTTPPVAAILNAPEGTVGNSSVSLTIKGAVEPATAYKYRLNNSDWSLSRPIDLPVELSGLSNGSYTIEVIAMDAAGNWQTVPNATEKEWVISSDAPVLRFSGLPDTYTEKTSATIYVGGSGVVAYMYSIDGGEWTYGLASSPIALTDLTEGEHILKVRGLTEEGDVGDSGSGATTLTWIVDSTAPVISDLTAGPGTPGSTTAELTWSWASDTSEESIEKYQAWYALTPITEQNLGTATEVYCDIYPTSEGATERFTINDLLSNTLYYFAVKATDAAGNTSDLSNIASLTTADTLPAVTGLALIGGGAAADNSATRNITITGVRFVSIAGDNIIRFQNGATVFDIKNTGGTATEMTAVVPVGAPAGTYRVRVLNKYGLSPALESAYTITEASVPIPEVTEISPVLAATDTTITLSVYGSNFTTPVGGVWIVDETGTRTALTDITEMSESALQASLTIPSGFTNGRYYISVENGESLSNMISSARLEIVDPIALSGLSGPVSTTGIVSVTSGDVSVKTVLKTDTRKEVEPARSFPTSVGLEIPEGTTLNDSSSAYSGRIASPREIPLSDSLSSETGNFSSEFRIGGDSTLYAQSGETMTLTIEITFPADAPEPILYIVGTDGRLTTAGISGTESGTDYLPGGTILAARKSTPETGYTTYTLKVLLTQLDTHYVVGSQKTSDSYGPCFIDTIQANAIRLMILSLLIVLSAILICLIKTRRYSINLFLILVTSLIVSVSTDAAEPDTPETFYMMAGVGYQHIDSRQDTLYYGTERQLSVRNNIYPVVRGGWHLSEKIALEAGLRYNLLSGTMEQNSEQDGRKNITGFTLNTGPLYKLEEIDFGFKQKWTPFFKADIGVQHIRNNLSYAVNDYKPSLGFEMAIGAYSKSCDIRFGFQRYKNRVDETMGGYTAGESERDLNLSGVFLEISYRFRLGL